MSFKDLMTYKRILIRHIYTSVISWWHIHTHTHTHTRCAYRHDDIHTHTHTHDDIQPHTHTLWHTDTYTHTWWHTANPTNGDILEISFKDQAQNSNVSFHWLFSLKRNLFWLKPLSKLKVPTSLFTETKFEHLFRQKRRSCFFSVALLPRGKRDVEAVDFELWKRIQSCECKFDGLGVDIMSRCIHLWIRHARTHMHTLKTKFDITMCNTPTRTQNDLTAW